MLNNLNFEEYSNGLDCCECLCYHVFPNTLFKMYYAREDAETARAWNSLAYENGIGPRPSSRIYPAAPYWGYFVQIVDTFDSHLPDNMMGELLELNTKFKEVFGFTYMDDHEYNLGLMDGKLVFIDFGPLINRATPCGHYDEKQFDFINLYEEEGC